MATRIIELRTFSNVSQKDRNNKTSYSREKETLPQNLKPEEMLPIKNVKQVMRRCNESVRLPPYLEIEIWVLNVSTRQ